MNRTTPQFQPTVQDRAETLALCKAIVRAVREDEKMPLWLTEMSMSHLSHIPVFDREDVEQLAFRLAQEVTLLAAQLAAMTAARDEACTLLQRLIDAQERYSPPAVSSSEAFAAMKREIDKRIDGLRKVGAL